MERYAPTSAAWRRTGLVLTWLAIVTGGGWLVHNGEAQQRDNLDEQMSSRAGTSAQFIAAYAQDVLQRNRSFAEATLAGDITADRFTMFMEPTELEAAVVLDSEGVSMAVFPADQSMVGVDLAATYAHLDDALDGVPSISGVVLSAVRRVPVVAFAVPYDTPTGRRVYSPAYTVSRMPLQSYLAAEAGDASVEIYLIDAAGSVVASRVPGVDTESAGAPALLADSEPELASAAEQEGVWDMGEGGDERRGVTVAVPGTPWRVVFAAPGGSLYAPAPASELWTERLVFLALALASLAAIALGERTATQRWRLVQQQTTARAVIDSAVDAFVGTDHRGVITDWNPAASQLFGWSAAEALGHPVVDLVLPERYRSSQLARLRPFHPGMGAARRGPVRLTGLTRDGREIPIEVSVSATGFGGDARFHAFIRDDRPRRVAEQQMRISAQVAESAGDAIFSRDLAGCLTSWNVAAERLFGWTSEQMLGTGLEHPLLGSRSQQVATLIEKVVTSQAVATEDTTRHMHSGGEVQVALTVAPLLDEVGIPVGVSVTARDIGEPLRLQDELRHSEGVFRSAFDDALIGMFLTALDGRLTRVNAVFATMLGRAPSDLLGRSYDDLIHPDFRPRGGSPVTSAEDGDGFREEMCYSGADGSPVWADTSTALIRDLSGQPQHFVTQVVDTTMRRALSLERAARERMLAAVISNSQSLIYVKDLDGRYLLANSAFERAFAVTESELLGKTDVYLDPDLAPVWRVNDVKAQDGAYQLEEWSESPNGHMYYESVKFPLFDAAGRLYATCGISLDVTGQREAAITLARARDEAVAATAAKSAFLATMSHEIRTPMNAVIGMTGLLLDTDLDAQQREFVETVRTSGDALLAVINDILDFSKIEAGQLTLEDRAFDLTDLAEDAIDLVAVSAIDKRLDLVCYVEPDCPRRVLGDPTRLRQVLVNLLANAIKFTATGSVLLRVSATGEGSDRHRLRFAVIDSGIGIPPDRMDRLFRSFSQVDDSTTRMYGGTGLGLAISRRLTEAMGGELTASSIDGVGSTFVCSVVMGTVSVKAEQGSRPAVAVGKTVLVVDDDPTCRQILALQLAGLGLSCVSVGTAGEALDLMANGAAYDLALLDQDLRGIDGVELGGMLRRVPGSTDLPLVLLAALGGQRSDEHCGSPVRLTKPVKKAALHQAVVEALTPHREAVHREPLGPAPRPASARRLRVLLVEDNTVNQRVAQLMVRKLGHLIDTVANGQEGVDAALLLPYDVILMDVQMPVMDGLEATRRIRTMLPVENQPYIVAMTASALLEDRDACQAAGMDAHLAKPVREADLRSAISGAGGQVAAVPVVAIT